MLKQDDAINAKKTKNKWRLTDSRVHTCSLHKKHTEYLNGHAQKMEKIPLTQHKNKNAKVKYGRGLC